MQLVKTSTPAETYKRLVIKDYEYWTLGLSDEQKPYVGRCYVWYKDRFPGEGDNLPFWELPDHVQLEVSKIARDVVRALKAFGYETEPYGEKFLLNTCYLSNGKEHKHHLHWHFIPRTGLILRIPEVNLVVHDTAWGENYIRLQDYGEYRVSGEQAEYIRKVMANAIG